MNEENIYELDKKFYTQQEVADLFRVSPGTIKNWREAGLLNYFQAPGSTRVLYPADTVIQFQAQHTKSAKVLPLRRPERVKSATEQGISSNRLKKEWRI